MTQNVISDKTRRQVKSLHTACTKKDALCEGFWDMAEEAFHDLELTLGDCSVLEMFEDYDQLNAIIHTMGDSLYKEPTVMKSLSEELFPPLGADIDPIEVHNESINEKIKTIKDSLVVDIQSALESKCNCNLRK